MTDLAVLSSTENSFTERRSLDEHAERHAGPYVDPSRVSEMGRGVIPNRGSEAGLPKSVFALKPSRMTDVSNLAVCVVDNEESILDSLRFLIEQERLTVRTFASAFEFLEAWDPNKMGCLILDVRMPGMSGLELQIEMERRGIRIPTIFITGFGDVQLAVQCMKRGALDYLIKPLNHPSLLERIHEALRIEAIERREAIGRENYRKRFNSLTPKEQEVAPMVEKGLTSNEIAALLNTKVRTVEAHRQNILLKMGCKNVAELVRLLTLKSLPDHDQG